MAPAHHPNPVDSGLEARLALLEGSILSLLRQFTDEHQEPAGTETVLKITASAGLGAVVIDVEFSLNGDPFLGLSL